MHSESFPHDESVFSTKLRQTFAEIIEAERNAALCLAIVAARQMEKNRAALSSHDGRIVEANHYDEVVECILAPQTFVQARIGEADEAGVMGVVRHHATRLFRVHGRSRQDPITPGHQICAGRSMS